MNSKGTVLIIDNDNNCSISRRGVLTRNGYTVHTATAIAEARQMIWDIEPDVIVMETVLPDGDGFAFCEEIRGQTNAYIMFLTSKTGIENLNQCTKSGGNIFLTKPYHMPEFVERIKIAMRRKAITRKEVTIPKPTPEIMRRGPLSFDSSGERVFMGSMELTLPEDEVYTLWRLVQSMDAHKTFDEIYSSVWDMKYYPSEWDSYEEYARGLTSRESALQQLTHLMETVNTAGKGEVWIENDTDRGYLFRMRQ
jgi:DNA-binding response OmpR family regulator